MTPATGVRGSEFNGQLAPKPLHSALARLRYDMASVVLEYSGGLVEVVLGAIQQMKRQSAVI